MGNSVDDSDDENVLVKLTSLAVLGLGLTSLFLDVGNFLLIFVIGFAVVVPLVKLLTREFGFGESSTTSAPERRTDDSESTQDALDALRDRYARGELSEETFERKVETLLETETPENARNRVGSDGTTGEIRTETFETDENSR